MSTKDQWAEYDKILEAHNARFTYKRDTNKWVDDWRVVTHDGPFKGDCEDWSLALLWQLSGKSWVKFWWNMLIMRGVIWHAKTKSGESHAVLKWRGKWADNIYPYFRADVKHNKKYPYLMPFAIVKLLIGKLVKDQE